MHSNETDRLKLALFTPPDHPDFLTDWNESMRKIDEYASSMDFITEPLFKDVVDKQEQLIKDVTDIKQTNLEQDEKIQKNADDIEELEHGLGHEHDRNDNQDVTIKQMQEDIEDEVARAEEAERALDEKITNENIRAEGEESRLEGLIADEQTRAETEEARIEALVRAETERAEEVENTLNNTIGTIRENVEKNTGDIDVLKEGIQNEHERNDEQDVKLNDLKSSTDELKATVDADHNDIIKLKSDMETTNQTVMDAVNDINDGLGEIADFDGRINANKTAVDDIQQQVNNLVEDVNQVQGLKRTVDGHTQEIGTLTDSVNTVSGLVQENSEEIDILKNKIPTKEYKLVLGAKIATRSSGTTEYSARVYFEQNGSNVNAIFVFAKSSTSGITLTSASEVFDPLSFNPSTIFTNGLSQTEPLSEEAIQIITENNISLGRTLQKSILGESILVPIIFRNSESMAPTGLGYLSIRLVPSNNSMQLAMFTANLATTQWADTIYKGCLLPQTSIYTVVPLKEV